MVKHTISIDTVLKENAEKLEQNSRILSEIMPDYFFKSLSDAEIDGVLALMLNLDGEKIPLQRQFQDKIIRIYLTQLENPIRNSELTLVDFAFKGALVHESSKSFELNGHLYTLAVELYTIENPTELSPVFSIEEIKTYLESKSIAIPEGMEKFYSHIQWSQVTDLTIDRLCERMLLGLKVQKEAYAEVQIDQLPDGKYRMLLCAPDSANSNNYWGKIGELLNIYKFNIERAYWRQFTFNADAEDLAHQSVNLGSFYFSGDPEKMAEFQKDVKALYYTDCDDVFHRELVLHRHFKLHEVNLLRAGAEFIHSQFSFINRSSYNYHEISRLIALYPEISHEIIQLFNQKFVPGGAETKINPEYVLKNINNINSGVAERDELAVNVFRALLNFIDSIEKCNFFVENKGALSFRLSPKFMNFYAEFSPDYLKSFPPDLPYGVFFFSRNNAAGFQIRFAEIARGGWRTVIPKSAKSELEKDDLFSAARDEFFREGYVLAHTQNMKNKDIFEGGSKMITLLKLTAGQELKPTLWEMQKAVFNAFLSLINYDEKNHLKDKNIVDLSGKKEIIEIGPDENMFDAMIVYMGNYAAKHHYTIGAGIISGKVDGGFNHKEYGVTSFGVHQYLLRTMQELNINPEKDDHSLKISGGPGGDVAGNMLKLLLKKADGKFIYENQRIIAVTDGPAAIYDPAGIDRDELGKLVLKANLDKFDYRKLNGEHAYMIFSTPVIKDENEFFRKMEKVQGKIVEKLLTRDEFMHIFQNNLCHYADIFVPCGGRPSTINMNNYQHFLNENGNGCKAIVEGANSFITPPARIELQKSGILNVKDASANKCGVITSSYEIMSGLMLSDAEINADKELLVGQVMEKLKFNAKREAEWLFAMRLSTGKFMTELTDELSRAINRKNDEILQYLENHPEMITNEIIFDHLPGIFRTKYPERLAKLPPEYRKAIVSVELSCRIIYHPGDQLANEIKAVLN